MAKNSNQMGKMWQKMGIFGFPNGKKSLGIPIVNIIKKWPIMEKMAKQISEMKKYHFWLTK